MKARIPPIHALRALDAFARLGTVWEAAEELGITRSAVSHRLAMLETIVGFEVASRSGKGIALTPRGTRYAHDVKRSLALLAEAHEEGSSKPVEGSLRISSTAGFASMWLCNHIASFQAEYPNLCLQIITSRELGEATDRDVDLFIAFGDGNWPKHTVQHLYDVEFLPMCSPALQNMQGGLNQPADVLRFPLLHLQQWDDWREWLAVSGIEFPQRGAGIIFSDMMLVQTAAIAGQGIMMGDEITCAGALAIGQLVSPFSTKIKSRGGYYLVRSRQRRLNPAIVAFTRWLNALFVRIGTELKGGPF
ncbi:MAG TPA: LysR substrate-binding domain-containing protein [Steroidobacteraceae bacterium]|nr:LysR substrate-binding domain-containing protein [Steroidobacteraceae bacterium]